jgi:vacuolar-type H+-ATPase subunit I/STV1
MAQIICDTNSRYRGRLTGILLDEDVKEETDKQRGQLSRSKYINEALRGHNKRMAIMKQKMAELQEQEEQKEQLQKNEQALGTLLQYSTIPSVVGSDEEEEGLAVAGACFGGSSSYRSSDVRASSCISQQSDVIQTQIPKGDIGDPDIR